MNLFIKKTFIYASLCLLVLACSVQGFHSYHNWRATQWCNHFGAYYNELGGPPKNWEWPWNWSMLAYISISQNGHRSNYRFNSFLDKFPEPSLEDIRELIGHAKHLPRLNFVGIYIPFPFEANDIISLKNQKQIVVYTSTHFTNEEINFIRDSMPNTIVSIKLVK